MPPEDYLKEKIRTILNRIRTRENTISELEKEYARLYLAWGETVHLPSKIDLENHMNAKQNKINEEKKLLGDDQQELRQAEQNLNDQMVRKALLRLNYDPQERLFW